MNICVGVGMGMVARGQVLVGNGAGKVNSTWVDDVKGPDLHVCSCVCVCVCVCWSGVLEDAQLLGPLREVSSAWMNGNHFEFSLV